MDPLPFALVCMLHLHQLQQDDDSKDDAEKNEEVEGDDEREFMQRQEQYDDDDSFFDFLWLALCTMILTKEPIVHSRYQKAFHRKLPSRLRQLRDRRIPRTSLHHPHESAWSRLYHSHNDQSLVTMTGFDHQSFNWLLQLFEPMYNTYGPGDNNDNGSYCVRLEYPNCGRPRMLSAADCLGLNLAWTRLRGSTKMSLQMLFGMTASRVSKWLLFGRRLLIAILSRHPDAAVRIPSAAKIQEYKRVIQDRHPNLVDVWCTMDGVKLTLEQSGNHVVQNMFYNGWTHDNYVSSIFVFCPDGTIPIAAVNYPGCLHDSQIAESGRVYEKLESVFIRDGGKCVVDSAFSRSRHEFIIKSSQVDPVDMEQAAINREATSLLQTAEWGMRALQSSFPRLKDRIRYEESGERRVILKLMVLLFNLRSRRVGINQILNTYYMHSLERDANQEIIEPILRAGNNTYYYYLFLLL